MDKPLKYNVPQWDKQSNIFRDGPKLPCRLKEVKELKTINEALQKENLAKEREIRRLNKDVHKYEQTIVNLRSEISLNRYHTPDSSKKDAEVMAGMCCTRSECAGAAPADGQGEGGPYSAALADDAHKYQERIHKMENNLKATGDSVRALRKVNVALSEELHALRRVCAALDEQCRAAGLRAQFKDEIIREMRRQLKHAKAKLKESEPGRKSQKEYKDEDHKLGSAGSASVSYGSVSAGCVSQQPRRSRAPAAPGPAGETPEAPLHPDSDDCRTPMLDGSGDDVLFSRAD